MSPGAMKYPWIGMGETVFRHRLRCGDERLRDHLAAVYATGGEVHALAVDIGMVTILRRLAQFEHVDDSLERVLVSLAMFCLLACHAAMHVLHATRG